MLVAAIVLVIEAGVIDHPKSGGRLWTAQGMTSVLTRQKE